VSLGHISDQSIYRDQRGLQAIEIRLATETKRLTRWMLTDVLKAAITSNLDLRDGPGHPGSELAKAVSLARFIEAVDGLEEHRSVREHQERMKEVTVVAETITPSACGLRILASIGKFRSLATSSTT
jgi:hypothetical protein